MMEYTERVQQGASEASGSTPLLIIYWAYGTINNRDPTAHQEQNNLVKIKEAIEISISIKK